METPAVFRTPHAREAALDRATALLKQLAGGEVATGVVETYPGAREPVVLSLRPATPVQVPVEESARPYMP